MLQALLYTHHEDVYAYINAAQILSAMLPPHAVNQGWQVFAGWWKKTFFHGKTGWQKQFLSAKILQKIDFAT